MGQRKQSMQRRRVVKEVSGQSGRESVEKLKEQMYLKKEGVVNDIRNKTGCSGSSL
jgi:hypothetical protein